MGKPNPMGATFAERAAAARGEKDFTAPNPEHQAPESNSRFADRAGRTTPAVKQVDEDSEQQVEDKAVAKKATTRKSTKNS